MKRPAHSPAPWRSTACEDGGAKFYRIAAANGKTLAILPGPHGFETEADQALTVAAPEMLIAVCQYRDDLRFPPDPESIGRRLEMVEALIAKATATPLQAGCR